MLEPDCRRPYHCRLRGNSSVGRARPCQGRGREFESRFPLQVFGTPAWPGSVVSGPRNAVPLTASTRARSSPARWQSGHAADCKSAYAGSIPTLASNCFECGDARISAGDSAGIEPRRFDDSRHPWRSPFGPPSAFARVPHAQSDPGLQMPRGVQRFSPDWRITCSHASATNPLPGWKRPKCSQCRLHAAATHCLACPGDSRRIHPPRL